MKRLLEYLFGCNHSRTTFPLTPPATGRTYIVCLDCGKEFDYDWLNMRVATKRKEAADMGREPVKIFWDE